MAEAIARLVVAEVWPQHDSEADIGEAGSVAVAMLQAEIRHPASNEACQIHVGDDDRREHDGKYVHRPARNRIVHSRQVEQRLNRAFPYLPPQPLIFLPNLLVRRVR